MPNQEKGDQHAIELEKSACDDRRALSEARAGHLAQQDLLQGPGSCGRQKAIRAGAHEGFSSAFGWQAATDSLAATATLNDLPSLRKLAKMLEEGPTGATSSGFRPRVGLRTSILCRAWPPSTAWPSSVGSAIGRHRPQQQHHHNRHHRADDLRIPDLHKLR